MIRGSASVESKLIANRPKLILDAGGMGFE